jgi:hypothetical protein
MKVCNGRFGGAANHVGKLPTHGVYNRTTWELAKERAVALSLHYSFDESMTAAAKYERLGGQCMLVCFEEDSPATSVQPGSPPAETKATERRAQP